jgi:hypothetical protein
MYFSTLPASAMDCMPFLFGSIEAFRSGTRELKAKS